VSAEEPVRSIDPPAAGQNQHNPRGADQRRVGLLYGFGAFGLWGLIPFFFIALVPAGPVEIVAHRIVWTFLFCLILLAARRDWAWIRPMLRRWRVIAGLTVAALLIAANWLTYIFAVLGGQTSEAALGYFLNPLVTVALGVVVLGERLRPLQWLAVGIATLAAVFLTVVAGQLPLTALTLAVSFALYGLIKNRMGADLPALHGLTVETAVLTPPAAVCIWALGAAGASTFATNGAAHVVLMLLTGLVTATPLLLFAAAARRIPLVTIGLIQFIAPIMQLLSSLVLGEYISPARWVGFAIVWVALTVLTVDSVHARLRR
jgi:chloramphenicol-sensitive protein RarD